MENKKRTRLDMITNKDSDEEELGAIPMGTAVLTTKGGQSYILSNTMNSPLPADLLLSICDENSDVSGDYILDRSIDTQTSDNLVANTPQHPIINQKSLNSTSFISSSVSKAVNTNSFTIKNNSNLRPGCEIYVIKEVFHPPEEIIAESNTKTNTATTTISADDTIIDLDPLSPLSLQPQTSPNGNKTKNINYNHAISMNTTSSVTSTHKTSAILPDKTNKTGLNLGSCKRRETESERRDAERERRDEINLWIYKLKEVVPFEMQQQGKGNSTSSKIPKRNILRGACEYIESMNEEIKSLRKFVTENDNLRVENCHLQTEINSLRAKQQILKHNSNNILLKNTINNNRNRNSDISYNCKLTLNTTDANVQLSSPSTNEQSNNYHQLADL